MRGARWAPTGKGRGTVLVLPGRTEPLEKYFEFAGELLARGFCVATFDWRGQGLSSRETDDPAKGHVADFADYDSDVDAAAAALLTPGMPRPHLIFGHSMGGHMALRTMRRRSGVFAAGFVSAPMLKVIANPWTRFAARGLARLMCALGKGKDFVPGGGGNDGQSTAFADNVVTRDPGRYARNQAIIAADPARLNIKGPTYAWVRAAFRSMDALQARDAGAGLTEPVLIISAANDRVVRQEPEMRLVRHMKAGFFVLLSDAEHEILQERDEVRRFFWAAADAFLARHAPLA